MLRLLAGLVWLVVFTAVAAAGLAAAVAVPAFQKGGPDEARAKIEESAKKYGPHALGVSALAGLVVVALAGLPGTTARKDKPADRADPAARALPAGNPGKPGSLFDKLGGELQSLEKSKGGAKPKGKAADEGPAPDARVYTHHRCGGQTRVSGGDFAALADPLSAAQYTFCCTCNDMDTHDRFVWSDTGENIATYRARVKALAPWYAHAGAASSITLGVVVAVGAVALAASKFMPPDRQGNVIAGGVVGALIIGFGVFFACVNHGIDFRRQT